MVNAGGVARSTPSGRGVAARFDAGEDARGAWEQARQFVAETFNRQRYVDATLALYSRLGVR